MELADSYENALMVLFIVIGLGVLVSKLTEKPRIPDVAAFLLLGILLGPQVFHVIDVPSESQASQFVVYLGAALILFDGGRGVQFAVLRRVYISITLLVTVGVLVSAVLVGLAVHWLFDAPWIWSLLLASILSSTDPATLIPVFKRVPIVDRLQQTMETESAFNDATASVMVITLMNALKTGHSLHASRAVETFFQDSLIGLAVGASLGLIALWLVSERGWGVLHDFASIVMFTIAIGSYVVAQRLGASGLMAAFAAGILAGNGDGIRWPLKPETDKLIRHSGSVWTNMTRTLIFAFLGSQVDSHILWRYLWIGLAVVGVLMFAARPVSVLSSVLVDRMAKWNRREVTLMMWVRETGVIPAALAGTASADHLPHADIIMAVTFLAILCTIVIQATTTGLLAKRLGLTRLEEEMEL